VKGEIGFVGYLPTRVGYMTTVVISFLFFVGLLPTLVVVMPTKQLIEALFPRSRSAILAALTDAGEEGLHLREIARRGGLSPKSVMRELHSLRDAGILVSRNVGRQVVYRLNPDCPIYEDLQQIVRKTLGLAGILRSALEPLSDQIDCAYIYGSHASSEARIDSDIDLMVVGIVSLRELSSPLREAGRSLHREINPTLYTAADYEEERSKSDSFVSRIHAGPRIDVFRRTR